MIDCCFTEAEQINQNIISNLSPKVKHADVKFKKSAMLTCKKCNEVTKNIRQLHNHMKAKHNQTLNSSMRSDVIQSTDNLSVTEHLMVEDMSVNLTDEDEEINLHEVNTRTSETRKNESSVLAFKCKSDSFKTHNRSKLESHLENKHKVEDNVCVNYACTFCDDNYLTIQELDDHLKVHSQNENLNIMEDCSAEKDKFEHCYNEDRINENI